MAMQNEVIRLQKKVSKWTLEWVEDEISIELFWDDPPKQFEGYLSGEEDSPSRVDVGNLHFWHFVHYMHAVLNEGKDGLEDFALAAHYAGAVVRFEEYWANQNKAGHLLKDDAVFYYSLNVLAGWKKEANIVGNALYKGLDTHLLDLRHTDRHEAGKVYPHFWFIMHLFCQSEGLKLDTSLYSYPEDMSPYTEVLADWRTPDLIKVQGFVSALADIHVQETRPTRYEEISSFDGEDVMIFPYEILCWLRLREWAGLPNPDSFDHPLMNQPLAKMPAPVPLPYPGALLLDKVIVKFKQEHPGSFAP